MRIPFSPEVEYGRVRRGHIASEPGDDYGFFFLQRKGIRLKVMASAGADEMPWEHVSVSTEIRCPTWEEMAWVKDIFWSEDEAVVQFHPPKSAHVNYHPFCLHLWRPIGVDIALPPTIAVGPLGVTRDDERTGHQVSEGQR